MSDDPFAGAYMRVTSGRRGVDGPPAWFVLLCQEEGDAIVFDTPDFSVAIVTALGWGLPLVIGRPDPV